MPRHAGYLYDKKERLLGSYVYIDKNQELLDTFCNSWLKTYEKNNNFFLTIDLETTGLYPRKGRILLFSISCDGRRCIVINPKKLNLDMLKKVLNTIPISNQNIKFDLKWLIYHLGVDPIVFFDSMVASQLAWAGSFPNNSYALDNLANVILNIDISKAVREEFIGFEEDREFTDEQIEYSARDSVITHRLTVPILYELSKKNLLPLWENVERPLIKVMTMVELEGTPVDVEQLLKYHKEKEEKVKELLDGLRNMLQNLPESQKLASPEKFNPGSSKQIVDLMAKLGYKLSNTQEATLNELQEKIKNPILQGILDCRKEKSEISKFLDKWVKHHIDPATNKIYPNFGTCNTATGRMTCSDPNMQQVPGNLRGMICAPPGYKIITCDYGSYEFRAAAAVTKEPILLETFAMREEMLPIMKPIALKYGFDSVDDFDKAVGKGKVSLSEEEHFLHAKFSATDIHRRNSSLIFNVPVEEVSKQLRSVGKCVALDTYIHTSKGIMKVGDLLPKKRTPDTYYDLKDIQVLTDEGYRPAPKIYFNGNAQALEITTQMGRVLRVSPIHRFRTFDAKKHYVWRHANKLKPGDELFIKADSGFDCKVKKKSVQYVKALLLIELLKCIFIEGELIVPEQKIQEIRDYAKALDFDFKEKKKKDGTFSVISKSISSLMKDCKHPDIQLPDYILENGILLDKFVGIWIRGTRNDCPSVELAKQLQNILIRFGVSALRRNNILTVNSEIDLERLKHLHTPVKENEYIKLRKYSPDSIKEKTWDAVYMNSGDPDPLVRLKECLTAGEISAVEFLYNNNLRRDKVISVKPIGSIPLCDVTVPDNHTVVYEGLVSHNTLGYCVLYGGAAPRVQEALAKEGYYYTLEEAQHFIDTFFEKLPNMKLFIESVHRQVLDQGYVETLLGRKRFFELPPKWQSRLYETKKNDAFREATNFVFQGNNADATKLSLISISRRLREEYEGSYRPHLILSVHDENVAIARAEMAEEIGNIIEEEMIKSGRLATGNRVAIECSKVILERWGK